MPSNGPRFVLCAIETAPSQSSDRIWGLAEVTMRHIGVTFSPELGATRCPECDVGETIATAGEFCVIPQWRRYR